MIKIRQGEKELNPGIVPEAILAYPIYLLQQITFGITQR